MNDHCHETTPQLSLCFLTAKVGGACGGGWRDLKVKINEIDKFNKRDFYGLCLSEMQEGK
jgi:hypothetical protein